MHLDKEVFLSTLRGVLGLEHQACAKVGIPFDAYKRARGEDSTFAEECDAIKELALDFAEMSLIKKIKSGSHSAAAAFLKARGSHRGYGAKPNNINGYLP